MQHLGISRAATAPLLISGLLALAPGAALAEARGVADPAVSWGLNTLSDWGTNAPLLDLARVMRSFFAFAPEEWESMSHQDLAAGGYLGPDGYPLRIPQGMAGIRTIWAWEEGDLGAEGRKGLYILTYKGRATIQLNGAARTVNEGPGRIVFENTTGAAFWLDITSIDPGNPPREMSVVRAENADLLEAGAMFDPAWLSIVADGRELRFMDWMETNSGRAAVTWDTRPRPDDASWTDRGAPVEVMVRLANEAGIDPWFTMPHAADDAYVRAFATYVRDQLDPRLKVHVEYANENWNSAFQQFHWLRDQAIAAWGNEVADNWDAIFSYHGKRATEVALIWEDVFGAEAPARLVNVLGAQIGNVWHSERLLTAPEWALREPDTFVPPHEVFEELAATTYFGGALVGDPALRAELTARAQSQGDRAYSWMFQGIAQAGAVEDSIPVVLERLASQKAQAESYGLRLVVYEGGQHVHHSFAVDGLSVEEAERLSGFLADFVRSPEMAALYAQIWDGWREIGDGPFMQFVEMGAPSRWGSWGLLAHPGDRTQRSAFILERQAEGGSWWGEGGGPQYLQGITAAGTEGDDRMEGTDEEDFLAGRGGNDSFVASPGTDGISGGGGEDVYILPGPEAQYQVAPDGAAWRVTGPDGTARLVGVEVLEFGDGALRRLD
ncbi:MAG: hypothetical protein LPJ95_08915 [Paracoccaceae bacterium]|nr:hypothetical protein [Paracoccaceae bacterium]